MEIVLIWIVYGFAALLLSIAGLLAIACILLPIIMLRDIIRKQLDKN